MLASLGRLGRPARNTVTLTATLAATIAGTLAVAFALGTTVTTARATAPAEGSAATDLCRYVDPFIGTGPSNSPNPVPGGAGGSTIPGAMAPFGMIQFSPDTDKASPSGYGYPGTQIQGFSLTHFNGAGCPNNEDLPILPIRGTNVGTNGTGVDWAGHAATFSHTNESAAPGEYSVRFDDGILTELTATVRTGMARFTFPDSDGGSILFDTSRNATGRREGSLHIDGSKITGTFTSGGFCGSRTTVPFSFVVEFDRAPSSSGTWLGDTVTPGGSDVAGVSSGGWVSFDTSSDRDVLMKVAISYVDLDNAEHNLVAENSGWNWEGVRDGTRTAWNDVLHRIQLTSTTGVDEEDLVKFYTALYHVFSNPNVWEDVNGEYRGFDDVVHTTDGWTNYQNYSGWDIIRSWTHLIGAIAPEGPDILHSMVEGGRESGLLPFWTDRNVETQVMVGDPGTVNVANGYAMGVRGFDETTALHLMVKSANDTTDTQRWGLGEWIRNHHFPGNAAISLEYAMADFALAEYASALGQEELASTFFTRSGYWKELWRAESGYLEPKGDVNDDVARIYEVQVFGPDDPSANLALGKPTQASSICNDRESADKAANGTWNGGLADKWCDNESEEKWWTVDLGVNGKVDRFEIYHAGAGGETSDWNTRSFAIDVGPDGSTWSEVVSVVGNKDDVTKHSIDPVDARFVRFRLTKPESKSEWGCQPFDPASGCGYIEGNGAQYLWMVPHDLGGLIDLMGGPKRAEERLDHLFQELNAGTSRPHFYIGNEPEHGNPWTYNFAQAAPKTQAVVRRIIDEEFHTGPGGLPGNDDLGATSAWLVWAYLGMYPMIQGTDVLVLNGPYFPHAEVILANGNRLTIEAKGAGPDAPYIQSVRFEGKPVTKNWIRFADISGGGTLEYVMGTSPNPKWGCGVEDVPPSYGVE